MSGGFALLAGLIAGAIVAAPARAQLSFPTLTNGSNADETVAGTPSAASRERKSFVDVVSSPAGSFTTQYTSLITVDSDGAGAGSGVESIGSDYQIDFTATAPGAYVLTINTSVSGDMHLVNDGSSASADIGPISGSETGGSIVTGSFDIADQGGVSASGGLDAPFSDGSSATVFGLSNGAPIAHNLHFVFTQIVTSAAGGGDEAAIRLGQASTLASETAGDYPGSPARTQSDDGHFVTVTLTSLCGNGSIDSGPSYTEQCDEGPNNGQPGSCCASNCTFVPDGTSCSDNDICTNGDQCVSGACVSGTPQVCPLCQTCDGNSGCVDGPRTNCLLTTAPLQAKFQMKKKTDPTGNQVQFKWNRGMATNLTDFGAPLTTDDYALCVFAPGPVLKTVAPAGGTCGTRPCWKQLSIKGFSYKDSARDPLGVDKIVLKAGLSGKAKVQIKDKGSNIPTLPLPLSLPATIQLQSENGKCWEATFSSTNMQINDGTQFKGKGD
jgi:hypothetical protein